jgi:hypothetical protein
MRKDDLWIESMKKRLDSYSEPPSAGGWERLEKELSPSSLLDTAKHKRIVFRRWSIAVAAALLVAVSSVSVWLLQTPMVDEARRAARPVLATLPIANTDKTLSDTSDGGDVSSSVLNSRHKSENSLVAKNAESASSSVTSSNHVGNIPSNKADEAVASVQLAAEEDKSAQENNVEEVKSSSQERNKVVEQGHETKQQRVSRHPSERDKLQLPVGNSSSRRHPWTFGLAGNVGGLNLDGSNGGDLMMSDPVANSGKLDLSSASNGIVVVPQGEQIVFRDGLPYMTYNLQKVANINHKQPLSFGFSVRKGISNRVSIETGLVYTMLSSDITFEGAGESVSQKLHYIGIPLRANWNFLNRNQVTLYVSGGGMVEKCVYGEIESEKETVKPLQLSVSGAVGAQYNVSKKVGLYLEPGVSYYFDDGSAVQTIRKENPFTFTMQAGIRLTY